MTLGTFLLANLGVNWCWGIELSHCSVDFWEVAYRPPFLFSTICGRFCWGLRISCIFADGGGWADCWLVGIGRYLRLTPDSWLRSWAALRGWGSCFMAAILLFSGLVTDTWALW